ncbi:MAG: RNA-binding protein S1, partial [Acidaminococcaceae bacterium]|nr:RNA-binding protein S1 [Acidaminococcaceae bacterium]
YCIRLALMPAPEPPPRRPMERRSVTSAPKVVPVATFEDKMSRFLKDSDDRLLDLKRNTESKRGGRGARRGD